MGLLLGGVQSKNAGCQEGCGWSPRSHGEATASQARPWRPSLPQAALTSAHLAHALMEPLPRFMGQGAEAEEAESLAWVRSVRTLLHACFFQMRLGGASACSRWSPGEGEDWRFKVARGRGHHLGLPLTQLAPHDKMLACRCREAELGIYGGPGPRGQTLSWGGREVSLHDCCSESQGQSSHGGRGAQSAHCVPRSCTHSFCLGWGAGAV